METDKTRAEQSRSKVAVSAEAPEPSQMSLDATPVTERSRSTETNGTRKKDTKAPAKAAEAKEQVTEQPPSAGTEQSRSEVTERSRSARTEQEQGSLKPRPERPAPNNAVLVMSPRPVLSPAEVNPATKTPNNSQKSSDRSPPNPTKNS